MERHSRFTWQSLMYINSEKGKRLAVRRKMKCQNRSLFKTPAPNPPSSPFFLDETSATQNNKHNLLIQQSWHLSSQCLVCDSQTIALVNRSSHLQIPGGPKMARATFSRWAMWGNVADQRGDVCLLTRQSPLSTAIMSENFHVLNILRT